MTPPLPPTLPGEWWTRTIFSLFPSCIRNSYRNTSVLLPSPPFLGRQTWNWSRDGELWRSEVCGFLNRFTVQNERTADPRSVPSSTSTNSSAWFGLEKVSSHQGNEYSQKFLVYFLWPFTINTRLTRLCCLASFSLASSSSFWILRTCLFILRIVECKISQTNNLKVIRHLITIC